jgi:hypothetical protein
MYFFGYVAVGFLIVCMLLGGTRALSVDTASMVVAAADVAQVEEQNQTESVLERLQGRAAEEQDDLLNILD